MAKYRPTAEDKRIIRDCAQRSAGRARVEINPGKRISLTQDRGQHFNIALVSDHPSWDDTDLYDNAFTWGDFTKGVELTADGRAIVDFYVYETTGWKELMTNVVIYVEGGQLVRVTGVGNGTMWSKA